MKPALTRIQREEVFHFVNGNKIAGLHGGLSGDVSGLWGDVSGLRGDVSGLRGNVSGLRGDVSGLRGDVSGLWGNVTGLRGDVDGCGITDEERKNGIDIERLVMVKKEVAA